MTKVTGPLFGSAAAGRIGSIGTFRRGKSGAQFIRAPKAKKKKPKEKKPPLDGADIKALDANATTPEGTRVAIYPADRVNTSHPPASIVAVGIPKHGTAYLYSDSVIYIPSAGFTGTDSMSYTARDASGLEASATIRVKVTAIKKPKGKPPPSPEEEWLKEQLTLARKAWVKLPRKKYTFRFDSFSWRTHYYREPDWPEFWRQWLVDHPFEG